MPPRKKNKVDSKPLNNRLEESDLDKYSFSDFPSMVALVYTIKEIDQAFNDFEDLITSYEEYCTINKNHYYTASFIIGDSRTSSVIIEMILFSIKQE